MEVLLRDTEVESDVLDHLLLGPVHGAVGMRKADEVVQQLEAFGMAEMPIPACLAR